MLANSEIYAPGMRYVVLNSENCAPCMTFIMLNSENLATGVIYVPVVVYMLLSENLVPVQGALVGSRCPSSTITILAQLCIARHKSTMAQALVWISTDGPLLHLEATSQLFLPVDYRATSTSESTFEARPRA